MFALRTGSFYATGGQYATVVKMINTANFIREPETLRLTTPEHPIITSVRDAGLLSNLQLIYNAAIRELIGPRAAVLYGAAGAGFSDFHTSIDAPIAFFASDYQDVDVGECLQRAQYFLQASDLAQGEYLPSVSRYRFNKLGSGFASYNLINGEYFLAIAIATELKACGVEQFIIENSSIGHSISYELYGRDYRIYFVEGDVLAAPVGTLVQEIGMPLDTYYHRAAMEIPSRYEGDARPFFATLFQQMPVGGVFVTDDIAASPEWHWMSDYSDSFPLHFEGIQGELREETLADAILARMARAGYVSYAQAYGSLLRVRRKYSPE